MNVLIEKINNRFLVRSKYNKAIVDAIRKIDRRFWDSTKMEWILPIESLDNFTKELQQIGVQFEIKDKKPVASITLGENIQVKFDQYISDINMRSVASKYDKENRLFTVPREQKENLFQLLEEKDIDYTIQHDDNEKRAKKHRSILPKKGILAQE